MSITVTVRPGGARTEIRGLPWGKPGAGYAIIERAIEATQRNQVQYSRGAFSVARGHTSTLIQNLADEFGHVHVIQHGGQTRCVSACWRASDESAWECQCSCAGRNHGTGHPIGLIVSESGPHGALSVASTPPHEYDVYRSS